MTLYLSIYLSHFLSIYLFINRWVWSEWIQLQAESNRFQCKDAMHKFAWLRWFKCITIIGAPYIIIIIINISLTDWCMIMKYNIHCICVLWDILIKGWGHVFVLSPPGLLIFYIQHWSNQLSNWAGVICDIFGAW